MAVTSEETQEASVSIKQDFYPWHLEQKLQLANQEQGNRLHHAFLLYGPRYTGIFDFACAFASSLLCEAESKQDIACGECQACQLCSATSHPDMFILKPQKAGKAIVVDEVRELLGFMAKSASRNGKRIVIIDQSQQMNIAASNALLKFLEEPGNDVHLFLVCNEQESMLATIRSRCQKVQFPAVGFDQARDWLSDKLELEKGSSVETLLEYAFGSPLLALQLMEEDIYLLRDELVSHFKDSLVNQHLSQQMQKHLQELDLIVLLEYWYAYCVDILKLLAGAEPQHLNFKSHYASFETMALHLQKSGKSRVMEDFMQGLLTRRQQLLRGSPLNRSLCLDALLLEWSSL